MGNREDLLAGAKRCLLAKGYARTTARDIASASGVSLAAIGYHFGSKEALLNAALTGAVEEWADGFGQLSGQRFADVWPRVVESFAESKRLWAVQFELLAHMDSGQMDPGLRATLAEANRQAREGLVQLFGHDEPDDRLGALYQMLLAGAAALWLVDPASEPSADDLLAAMRTVAEQHP
ncbi:TetR/AcrR family transcriptional regulator [Nonomuraea glycinis]|uniref:TetR family transcriptional regulator n=1 Tax=Nonomuraea glycinis TaxID=2047744 RepID=A0A918E5R7_9ACTN|nr:TetR/AcrR family transcriptional regulator [Nonomuraea glycinis]GGP09592.1 TetR family transcriptional regulator [Nonomuraea glycinis]